MLRNENLVDIDNKFPITVDLKYQQQDIHPVSTGSIFYAVTGHGAWARSLAMPLGAGYEVSVSMVYETKNAALCESMETSHGDRTITKRSFQTT